jgi:hypothetical protein
MLKVVEGCCPDLLAEAGLYRYNKAQTCVIRPP